MIRPTFQASLTATILPLSASELIHKVRYPRPYVVDKRAATNSRLTSRAIFSNF